MTDSPKLVIFDLDGVLLDSREVHFEALNQALVYRKIPPITREEHLSTFDGLPTNRKLDILIGRGLLQPGDRVGVWEAKQIITTQLFQQLTPDYELIGLFAKLKEQGCEIAVASNSVRSTVSTVLTRLGLIDMLTFWTSNEDVQRPKPYPEMYWQCMTAVGALPKQTVIVEDSHLGRQGATDSGGHLIPVENRSDVTLELGERILATFPKTNRPIAWKNARMNVLIPMAGAGSRFAAAGYTFPKPLIEVRGKPMIQVVIENINVEANYHFIVQAEHEEKYGVSSMLNQIIPGCTVHLTQGMTEGAACTTLLAREYIDNDSPLLIANSDQFVEWNSNEVLYGFAADGVDAGIVTFEATHPKWSYAKLDENGFVSEVAEKRVISNLATVGIYYWKRGSDYVRYADQMIAKNIRVNGEFYVAPVFNEAIADGKKIRATSITGMHGIGTPEDLQFFLDNYKGDV